MPVVPLGHGRSSAHGWSPSRTASTRSSSAWGAYVPTKAHRNRIEGRDRGIPGWPATVTWVHLRRMQERWEDWEQPHLVLDTTTVSPGAALRRILDLVALP